MTPWPKRPIIYEINTWVWLHELSDRYKTAVTLDSVPPHEWDALAALRVDAAWLMGVWERSPVGVRVALADEKLQAEFGRALPDVAPRDVVGSPYCVHRYVVDDRLGGRAGLACARERLAERGLRLILDFVPNHLACDHPWVLDHPEYFVQGSAEELAKKPGEFFEARGKVLAHGRDPYFPPWLDVAQLNIFHPELRRTAVDTLCDIAGQCDGARCDMAMLLINRIFARTWGDRAGSLPNTEFWPSAIRTVRERYPNFLFIAEVYWDLERELQQQGFDYCYDKPLYDRLLRETAESIRALLCADPAFQEKLIRFIENHDEARAAAAFPTEKSRAAAVTIATLPGAKLFHDGQFEGRIIRVPVQLGRRPAEPLNEEIRAFYQKLIHVISERGFREGEWRLCEQNGWPDNTSYRNLVAWCWRAEKDRCLVAVNFSGLRSQGRARLLWNDLAGRSWRLIDAFTGEVYEREGNEMLDPGLYIDLLPWGFHCLRF